MRRKHPSPIMDFSLMKVPSFRTSVIAGSLTRITQGAQPFLIPLMLQFGFGLSAAAAAGPRDRHRARLDYDEGPRSRDILRTLGFRTSLVIFGIDRHARLRPLRALPAGLADAADLRRSWCLCGFFMSFQFTAYNTIAYDEIDRDRHELGHELLHHLPAAHALARHLHRALALHGSMAFNGAKMPTLDDFSVAFIVVALISITATIWNLRFSRTAGAEISGHRRKSDAASEH